MKKNGKRRSMCPWLTLLLGSMCCFSVFGQTLLTGIVADRFTKIPVPYAHLFTTNGRAFGLSGETGRFVIQLLPTDTLTVSAIGYQPRRLPLSESVLRQMAGDTLWLYQKRILLEEVVVWSTYGTSLLAVGATRRKPYRGIAGPKARWYEKKTIGLGKPQSGQLGIAIEGVLTQALMPFSAKYRQWKKLRVLRARKAREEYYERTVQRLLPNKLIKEHTVLLDEEEITSFLKFWRPSLAVLKKGSDYEKVHWLKAQENRYIEHLKRMHAYKNYRYRVSTLELRRLWREHDKR